MVYMSRFLFVILIAERFLQQTLAPFMSAYVFKSEREIKEIQREAYFSHFQLLLSSRCFEMLFYIIHFRHS